MVYSVQVVKMHAGKLLKGAPTVQDLLRFYDRFGETGREALADMLRKGHDGFDKITLYDVSHATKVAAMKEQYSLIHAGLTRVERAGLLDLKDRYQKGIIGEG